MHILPRGSWSYPIGPTPVKQESQLPQSPQFSKSHSLSRAGFRKSAAIIGVLCAQRSLHTHWSESFPASPPEGLLPSPKAHPLCTPQCRYTPTSGCRLTKAVDPLLPGHSCLVPCLGNQLMLPLPGVVTPFPTIYPPVLPF